MSTEGKVVMGIGLATILMLVGLVWFGGKKEGGLNYTTDFSSFTEVGDLVNEGDFQQGSVTAKVTLVNFSDFECPYCRQVHPVILGLKNTFSDEELRIVFRHLPLTEIHNEAYPAAVAAQAATNQGKFKEYADALFANPTRLGEDFYQSVAEQLGLDLERFNADRQNPQTHWQAFRARNLFQARQLPLQTPTIFINGELYTGDNSVESLEAAVRAAL